MNQPPSSNPEPSIEELLTPVKLHPQTGSNSPTATGSSSPGQYTPDDSRSEKSLAGQGAPRVLRHFPQGWPEVLNVLLLQSHHDVWLANMPDHGPAALTGYVWHQIVLAGLVAEDEEVWAGKLQSCSKHLSLNLSYVVARKGLQQLEALGFFEFISSNLPKESMEKKSKKPHGHPPKESFIAVPLEDALFYLSQVLYFRVREKCFEGVPDNVHEDFGLSEAAVKQAQEMRADLIDRYAEQRAAAQEALTERMRLFRGKYSLDYLLKQPAVNLPPHSQVQNLARYREALLSSLLARNHGKLRIGAERIARQLGVERHALYNICDRIGVIAEEQWETTPVIIETPLLHQIPKMAGDRGWGCRLESSSGEVIEYVKGHATAYQTWVQEQHEAGNTVAFAVQVASLRRYGTEDELAERAKKKRIRKLSSLGKGHDKKAFGGKPGRKPKEQTETVAIGFSPEYIASQAAMSLHGYTCYGSSLTNMTTGERINGSEAWMRIIETGCDNQEAPSEITEALGDITDAVLQEQAQSERS